MEFSENLKEFIENQKWFFAKTYAKTWPHEYIVQEKVDNNLFLELANYIDKYGYNDYFDYNVFTYWHMENIINRCINGSVNFYKLLKYIDLLNSVLFTILLITSGIQFWNSKFSKS